MGAEGESSVSGGGAEQVNVNIRCSNGSKFSVRTSLESMVGEFKGVLAQNCDVPAEQQRLIYKGRILKDDQTLVSYGILFPFKFFFFCIIISKIWILLIVHCLLYLEDCEKLRIWKSFLGVARQVF